ncbi:triose-phosphate isomerase [Halocola ammonii]
MRKKMVAGNWKMNLLWDEAKELVNELDKNRSQFPEDVSVVIAPPSAYLSGIAALSIDVLTLSGQNCSDQKSGAFTGEISAEMLRSMTVDYCIVGHSERRSLFGETDELVAKKAKACLNASVHPIICFGEKLEERKAGNHFEVVKNQVSAAIDQLSEEEMKQSVLAYEPVWAIGTGETASSEQAQEIHASVRKLVAEKFNDSVADSITILYGGSVKPANAEELFSCEDVDGGLIGGASLKAEDFLAIIKAAK